MISSFKAYFVLFFCFSIMSCASNRPFTGNASQTEDILLHSQQDPSRIIFQNGDTTKGYRVAVKQDSTEWYGMDNTTRHTLRTSGIRSISVASPNIPLGMVEGAGLGALLGTLIWGSAALSVSGSSTEHPSSLGDDIANAIGFKAW